MCVVPTLSLRGFVLISGDHTLALMYHEAELSLCESSGDQLGTAIAHRRIGECQCELGQYSDALSHQNKHLKIARQMSESTMHTHTHTVVYSLLADTAVL